MYARFDSLTTQFAKFLYWVSLLLMLVGMWVLINPFNSKAGATSHIYITLGAFELYIWLVLVLARWQVSKGLISFAARSGIFAVVLTGFNFMALNELYMASAAPAYLLSIVMVGLTIARMLMARRWMNLLLPVPMLIFAGCWMLMLALPAPFIRIMSFDRSVQHGAALVLCWILALWIAGHVPLVAWQYRQGFNWNQSPFSQWWISWFLLAMLAVFAVGQLYAAFNSLYIQWAGWYFTPVGLAGGAVLVILSHACRKHCWMAWIVLLLTVVFCLTLRNDTIPDDFPAAWLTGPVAYLIHPLYPAAAFVSIIFVIGAILLRQWWLFSLAAVSPLAMGITRLLQFIWQAKQGKGISLLLSAFILLGAGATLQWFQQRWHNRLRMDTSDLTDANKINNSAELSG